ncbi:hypothetical protein E2C01_055507 [Portunus trituberculatus]|uniref:Uncharacterized protein n=1 Tax=Portunus trituberculatus TaxID=210409 RepID=A0A5B7GVP0_PORTR|nr:hypothetical protein [Portunus trituberculatus]
MLPLGRLHILSHGNLAQGQRVHRIHDVLVQTVVWCVLQSKVVLDDTGPVPSFLDDERVHTAPSSKTCLPPCVLGGLQSARVRGAPPDCARLTPLTPPHQTNTTHCNGFMKL